MSAISNTSITRRQAVAAAAGAGIALGALGAASALADEQPAVGSSADASADAAAQEVDPVWGEAPKDVSEFDFAETLDCDLVVVGAGTAGMPCAVSAAQSGLKVVVLEKAASGFGMRSYIGAVGSTLQKESGVDIDVKDISQELLRYSSYRANASLIRLWAERSGEAVDWYSGILQDAGMKPWLETDINHDDESQFREWSTCHMHYSEDGSLVETSIMADKMVEVGCDVRYSTAMVQLIQEDGRVTGVVAQVEDGSYLRVNASKGVALATGGYAANIPMLRALNEKDYLGCIMGTMASGSTGDGIRAAHYAGGAMDVDHTAMYFQRGCTLPGHVGGDWSSPSLWWMGSQPFLEVNTKGERFANESLPYDYNLHQAAGQPGHVFIQVFDSNWQQDVLAFHTIGCSRIVTPEMQADGYEAVSWTLPRIEAACVQPALEGGQLVQADTIEELAEKIGLDPSTLSATVERYNELCEKGEDEDFYKESYRMRPVAQPPFYAVTVGGQLLCTMDGMVIDTQFRVLDEQGEPIPGLYAIGNDSGSYFADCYPELVVGAAAGRSLTFGYLLGQQLAQ